MTESDQNPSPRSVAEDEHAGRIKPRGPLRTAQAITVSLIVVAIVIAIFILQNTQSQKITFLVWTAHMAVAGALLLAAGLGALLAFLITYGRQLQFRRAVRREHRLHSS